MIVLVFAFYFAIAVFVVWLMMFPGERVRLSRYLLRFLGSGFASVERGLKRSTITVTAGATATRTGVLTGRDFLFRRRLTLLGVLLLLTFPPLVAMHMRGRLDFSRFDSGVHDSNAQVSALLTGEHLAPPESLPPEVFTTREVELIRPGLGGANRDWHLLKPGFRQRLLAVFKRMRERYGYKMVLIEGYRSPERQTQLANKGPAVTDARAGQSYHQYGLAADCAFYHNGKLIISGQNPWALRGYRLYGAVARHYGLTWGGGWRLKDYGHVELRGSRYDDPGT